MLEKLSLRAAKSSCTRPAGHGKPQDDIGTLPVRGFAVNGSRPGQAWPSCGPVTQGTSADEPPGGVSSGERHPCVFSVRNGTCGT
ncbi:hypothetical protein CCUS01_05733 [Colletotrichum cuscutae]|uniref:Uncharacterized protein n=1 Tax=Colletotrichum cuscutae TaxID=1209917 RepID=A0AAI9Y3N3_9PEZI|nr:hypothetical protein CCUS01_05733 [Colletotrichum cuscutae]